MVALFVGYPVWWLLGVTEVAAFGAALVMAYELAHRRRLPVPHGFGLWLLFLAWLMVGITVLQVDAPGAVSGASQTRYLVWAYRLAWYLTATIILLYVCKFRRELTTLRIARILSYMFLTIVVGGLVGVVAPHLSFPSALEVVLPRGLANNAFVHAQIHPTLAELQDYVGNKTARASAPFAYANEWGYNFACFLPFFVYAWCSRDAGWRRIIAPIVLAAALLPVIYSLNRGLWIALVASAVFVAIRSAMAGKLRMIAALMVGLAVTVGALTMTPLGQIISSRFGPGHNSNQGRSNLATLSVESVLNKSPIVGYGTTRFVQGNWLSIAGGATADCPRCSPPALGTQGNLWLIIFATGLGGALFYLGFFLVQFLRNAGLKSSAATMALSVLIVQFLTMPIYDLSGPALASVMIAIGVLSRERADRMAAAATTSRSTGQPREISLRTYFSLMRAHATVIVSCALLGVLAGGIWQEFRGNPAVGHISVLLPAEPTDPEANVQPSTLDSLAQSVQSPAVIAGVARAIGGTSSTTDIKITVTADPNSRIMNLFYTGANPAAARKGVAGAASSLLQVRGDSLKVEQATVLRSLRTRQDALSESMTTVSAAIRRLQTSPGIAAMRPELRSLQMVEYETAQQWYRVSSDVAQVSSTPVRAGEIVRPATARVQYDGWMVALSSGLMVGLVIGLGLGLLRDAVGIRLSHRKNTVRVGGVPVLAQISAAGIPSGNAVPPADLLEATRVVRLHRPVACLSAGSETCVRRLANYLDGFVDDHARTRIPGAADPAASRSVLLVASRNTRVRRIVDLHDSVTRLGCSVAGIVVAIGKPQKDLPPQ